MWDKFGEFDSYEELNKAAEGLKTEGDTTSLEALAAENGIDSSDLLDYIAGGISELATAQTAALGKLDIEAGRYNLPKNILINDWINQIRTYALEDEVIALAVRKKSKSLTKCIAAILKEAFGNQWTIPREILEEADINANRVTFGVPSAASVNTIIRAYYTEA